MSLSFATPSLLWFLLLLPLLWYAYRTLEHTKKKEAMAFSHLSLIKKAVGNKTSWRATTLAALEIASIALIIIALADPTFPLKNTKQGVNVVLALDVSGSMQATDYSPNRLEAAKKSAAILVESLTTNDLVGIVVFSEGATTASYFTKSKEKTVEKLSDIVPRQGRTAIGDGLALAIDMVTSIPNKKQLIVLLSDGVNNAGIVSLEEAVEFAKNNNVQIYTIGMGSEEAVVIGYDFFGSPQYAELDEEAMRTIAIETGGEYYKSVNEKTLSEIYEKLTEKFEREEEQTSIKNWILIMLLFVIAAQLYIRYGKYRVIQ